MGRKYLKGFLVMKNTGSTLKYFSTHCHTLPSPICLYGGLKNFYVPYVSWFKGNQSNHSIPQDREFPGGPVAETPRSQCRGPGFDPGSGNQISHAATKRSCKPQLKQRNPYAATKIPHAATKTRHSQIIKINTIERLSHGNEQLLQIIQAPVSSEEKE